MLSKEAKENISTKSFKITFNAKEMQVFTTRSLGSSSVIIYAFLDNIQIIPLPSYSDAGNSFAGSNSVVSGWGRPSDSVSTISDVLRYVEVEVIANLICNIYFLGLIQNTQVCTSGDGGRSTCNGDSGGPLVVGNRQVSKFKLCYLH